jgi:hypothetical protein
MHQRLFTLTGVWPRMHPCDGKIGAQQRDAATVWEAGMSAPQAGFLIESEI